MNSTKWRRQLVPRARSSHSERAVTSDDLVRDSPELDMDWIHPWIGLDWIGLDWVRWLQSCFFIYIFSILTT